MDKFEEEILAILQGHPGFGIFTTVAQVPGRGRVRHWFSLGIGLASLQCKTEYREIYRTVPEWVLDCHPYHQMRLCRLAVQAEQQLPETRPQALAS